MKKRIKLQGGLMAGSLIIIAIFYRYILPEYEHSLIWNILGVALVISGYLLRISARGVKAELNPDGKALVTKGPYALTRNPMYLGTLIIGIGFTGILFRWWVSLVFLTAYLGIYIPQIKKEEEKLFGFFGASFKDYCKKTPRFFPNVRGLFNTNPKDYLGIKQAWLKKELPSLIITFVLIVVMKTAIHFLSKQ